MNSPFLIQRFYIYQKERFPIALLALSLLPATMSSGAIVIGRPSVAQISIAVVASLLYLFHIRVIDEHRDFEHDNLHHATRPIQAGTISKQELRALDVGAGIGLLVIALYTSTLALSVLACMLVYSFFAGKEFFVGEKIRKHFFAYNAVNVIQMLLLQLFVYSLFGATITTSLLLWHFLFTTFGTVLFEFIRKIYIPGEDGTGNDTYSSHLGFTKAVCVATVLLAINAALFLALAAWISNNTTTLALVAIGAVVMGGCSALVHIIKKQRLTGQGMQLTFLCIYAGFNIALYALLT